MFEKRYTAKRYKRLGDAPGHRCNSAPVARRQDQTLIRDIHGLSITSVEKMELSAALGIFGA